MSDNEFRNNVHKAEEIIQGLNDAIRTLAHFCESQKNCENCPLCTSYTKDKWRCRFTGKCPEEWEVI